MRAFDLSDERAGARTLNNLNMLDSNYDEFKNENLLKRKCIHKNNDEKRMKVHRTREITTEASKKPPQWPTESLWLFVFRLIEVLNLTGKNAEKYARAYLKSWNIR